MVQLREVNRRIDVLLVIGSLAMGGAERQMQLLAQGLVRRGCRVAVFTFEPGGALATQFASSGVTVFSGECGSAKLFVTRLFHLGVASMRLLMLAFRFRPAVIHGYLPLACLAAGLVGRIAGIRQIVCARRALGTHQDRRALWRPIDWLSSRLAHVVTANSAAVARDAAARDRIPVSRICVIHNGVDFVMGSADASSRAALRARFALEPDQVAFVCVANLIPYKGHADLLAAFAMLCRHRPAARLFLVGEDRGIGESLRRRARELGIDANVVWLGFRSDVASILGAMDVAVHASHEEGMSNALIEYLAAGLSVVATDVGGNAEVLGDLPGCWLVPAHDPEALAAAMESAVNLPVDGCQVKIRQQSVASRFSVDAMVARHVELYGLT